MKISDIQIETINYTLDHDKREQILKKCQRLLSHESKIISLSIELIVDSHSKTHQKEHIAKGHMGLKGKPIFISTANDSMDKSIDLLVDKLDRSLRRKSRMLKFKRHLSSLVSKAI